MGAVFTATLGRQTAVLWAALPVVVFFAAYASNAIGFLVGQAAFTVTVAILFNLLVPVGWHVGLLRVEDVALPDMQCYARELHMPAPREVVLPLTSFAADDAKASS